MGLFGLMNNRKKTEKDRSKLKHRRAKKAQLKKQRGPRIVEVKDMELLSKEQIKKTLKSTHVNITVSGKRRNKMLKRLRHQERANFEKDSEMEVEVVKSGKSKRKKSSSTVDEEMGEENMTS